MQIVFSQKLLFSCQCNVSSKFLAIICRAQNNVCFPFYMKIESDQLVIGILNTFFNNKKIKAISDTGDLIEHAVYSAAVEENSVILQTILRWNQNNKTKKFTHKSKVGGGGGPTGLSFCLIVYIYIV